MRAHADDRITLVGSRLSLYYLADIPPPLIHRCQAIHRDRKELTTREHLDPCVTGNCRYCGLPLPIPAPMQAKPMRGPVTSEK